MEGNWFDGYPHTLDQTLAKDFNPFPNIDNVPTHAPGAAQGSSPMTAAGAEVNEVTQSQFNMATAGPRKILGKRIPTGKKLPNFSVDEDRVLVSSWLNVSTDPIVSTGQRSEAYWKRICDAYQANRGSYPERTQKSLTKRWDSIKENVSLFAGFYQQVLNRNQSGMTDSDKVLCTQLIAL